MAYYGARETVAIRGADAEYARIAGASPQFFQVFGVRPIAGRFPTAEEMKSGNSGAVLISYTPRLSTIVDDQCIVPVSRSVPLQRD